MAAIGGPGAGAIELKPDGTFTAEITVSKAAIDAVATAENLVNYGIYTYAGSGATNAGYDPITFSDPTGSVTVSKTEFLTDETATVTVEGSGFDPAAVTSPGAPIAGRPAGVFVTFSKFSENWRPSENAPSANRLRNNAALKWAVLAEDMDTIGGPSAGAIELNPDGTFTTELTIDKSVLDALTPNAAAELPLRYGIYTYAGSVGTKYAPYETYTPITFVKHDTTVALDDAVAFSGSTKDLTVSVTDGATGDITLSGLPGGDLTATIDEGEATFTVPSSLTIGSYALTAAYPGDANHEAAQDTATLRVVSSTPVVTVSKTEVFLDETATVTVTGSGFDPAAATGTRPPFSGRPGGAYVVVGYFAENWKPSAGAPSGDRKIVTQKWALPTGQWEGLAGSGAFQLNADGTFETTLEVSKDQLDTIAAANPTLDGNFGIYTYPGSGATNAGYETYTPITFVKRPSTLTNITGFTGTYGRGGSIRVTVPTDGTLSVSGLASARPVKAGVVTIPVARTLTPRSTTHTVQFTPTDTANYLPSTARVTVKITKAAAAKGKVKVARKPTTKKKGKAVVTVAGVKGAAAPTGKVRVKLTKGKTNRYVTVKLNRNGRAAVTLPKLKKGTWTIRVAYFGNANYTKRAYVKTGKVKITK